MNQNNTTEVTAAEAAVDTNLADDFDLDVTVEPRGEHPDTLRIFASATVQPCQCNTSACH